MTRITGIMDRVLFALSVPKCVCCGERLDYGQNAFCPKCSAEFQEFRTRNCAKCSKLLHECDCSSSYLEAHFVKRVIKCYRYINKEEYPSNSLIFSLKRDNRKDVLEVTSDLLIEAIRNSIDDPEKYIFTNVPRRKSAIIEYGIDHSALLAKEIARKIGAEYIPLLKSNAKKPQKSLETNERMLNADFDLITDIDLADRGVIIVDDIITSGASISSAAMLIRSLGCKNIVAAALAIAYKDE
ncbi:MAG: ComF family protein [Clostridia bacterium]|nr:ComF family protein [Clostridia bacterium]